MKKDYILFIDSGIGGLSTLAETCKILHANYIYFADIKNCPYGNLSKKEIETKYAERITSRLFGEYYPLMFTGVDVRKQKVM